MTQELEIEFKNLLTKYEYDLLLLHFNIQQDNIVKQVNYYFDTPNGHLKKVNSGLRIRQINSYYECTLKEKSSENTHIETNVKISEEVAKSILNNCSFSLPEIKTRLDVLQIPQEQLQLFGTLHTDRIEIDYKGGLLVLDHSNYLQQDDYEVEYETSDEKIGFIIFNEFLQQFDIPVRRTEKKIARFMQALLENQ